MAHLYKRKGMFWVKWYATDPATGKRKAYYKSTGATKLGDAQQAARLLEGDAARGVPVVQQIGKLTFDEACADLLTAYRVDKLDTLDDTEGRIRNHLAKFFAGRKMTSIGPTDWNAYIARRQAQGAANATINLERAALRRAFSLAVENGKLAAIPHLKRLKPAKPRQGFFEPEQYAAVLQRLDDDVRPLVEAIAETGWRGDSEVVPWTWRNVDLKAGEVRIEDSKNGDARVFPFTARLRGILERQRNRVHELERKLGRVIPHVWVWTAPRGSRKVGAPIKSYRGTWKRACTEAGCPGRHPHDFRRTQARDLERAGVPRAIAKKLLGMKTDSIYARYNIAARADLDVAVEKIDKARGE